jgi:hypothetical protein
MATQGQGVFVASGDRGANGGVGPSLASHEAAIGLLSLADLNLLAETLDPMRKTDLAISPAQHAAFGRWGAAAKWNERGQSARQWRARPFEPGP